MGFPFTSKCKLLRVEPMGKICNRNTHLQFSLRLHCLICSKSTESQSFQIALFFTFFHWPWHTQDFKYNSLPYLLPLDIIAKLNCMLGCHCYCFLEFHLILVIWFEIKVCIYCLAGNKSVIVYLTQFVKLFFYLYWSHYIKEEALNLDKN